MLITYARIKQALQHIIFATSKIHNNVLLYDWIEFLDLNTVQTAILPQLYDVQFNFAQYVQCAFTTFVQSITRFYPKIIHGQRVAWLSQMTSISKVDKLEVTKQYPNLKEQLLHKLEDIAVQVDCTSSCGYCTYWRQAGRYLVAGRLLPHKHRIWAYHTLKTVEDIALQEERRLEENANVLATQVPLQSMSNIR